MQGNNNNNKIADSFLQPIRSPSREPKSIAAITELHLPKTSFDYVPDKYICCFGRTVPTSTTLLVYYLVRTASGTPAFTLSYFLSTAFPNGHGPSENR